MEWRNWIAWWVIFCIRYSRLVWIYLKKHGENTDNPSVRIYVNKIENWITLKNNRILSPTFKAWNIEISKSKITKDKNGDNVLH